MNEEEKANLARRLNASLYELNMLIGTALANGMVVEIGNRSGAVITTVEPQQSAGSALTIRLLETTQTDYSAVARYGSSPFLTDDEPPAYLRQRVIDSENDAARREREMGEIDTTQQERGQKRPTVMEARADS